MKKIIIFTLITLLTLSMFGCSSKKNYNTGDKQLDAELEALRGEMLDEMEEDKNPESSDTAVSKNIKVDRVISYRDLDSLNSGTNIIIVIDDKDGTIADNNLAYSFFMESDFYGEKFNQNCDRKTDVLLAGKYAVKAYLPEVSKRDELQEYKLTFKIKDLNGKEVKAIDIDVEDEVFYKNTKGISAEKNTYGLEIFNYNLDNIKESLNKNPNKKVEFSISNISFSLFEKQDALNQKEPMYNAVVTIKVKNNMDVLYRIPDLSVYGPDVDVTFFSEDEIVKPGEEREVTVTCELTPSKCKKMSSINEFIIRLDSYTSDTYGKAVYEVDNKAFKEALSKIN